MLSFIFYFILDYFIDKKYHKTSCLLITLNSLQNSITLDYFLFKYILNYQILVLNLTLYHSNFKFAFIIIFN